jgi:phosphoribosylaminoimidazolecarboxamide formyltransferase / IMP cyclohydrolase
MHSDKRRVKRALISVSDKTGLLELAKVLAENGVEIVSTGSTASTIAAAGIAVTPVASVTGFPECLDGRVKTLHPNIHGGLLADVNLESHRKQVDELGIQVFELAVINLYPFSQTVLSGAEVADCIEQIDIGGPAMVRAAAKNHANVAVVVSPERYAEVISAIQDGGFSLAQRKSLAAEAFRHTATYDVNVANWMLAEVAPDTQEDEFPIWVGATYSLEQVLRYGENPHQAAAAYRSEFGDVGIAGALQLHGKPMSYNNFVDADAARRAAYDFTQPAVAIVKHANPCGIAVAADIETAHLKAHATDSVSAFGGVIAANREINLQMAQQVAEIFTEVIVAPSYSAEALALLSQKPSIRILQLDHQFTPFEFRQVSGGLLIQKPDIFQAAGDEPQNWQLVAGKVADAETLADLEFAWRACRSAKSNAVLLAKDLAAVGIGMGQVNRVDSARIAVARAGSRAAGSVAASDAFFPFADGLEVLLDADVKAVVSPGGSVRDAEVVAAAEAAGVTLYFTGTRHFFH